MESLLLVSLVPLFGAFGLGAIDGLYFHLQRYRLFAHPETRYEHALHTVRAWLVLPPLTLLYLADSTGGFLWFAALCIAADQVALALDLHAETSSRRHVGGLSPAEYQIHVVANGLHGVALALALASRPADAWSLAVSSVGASSLQSAALWALRMLWLAAAVAAVQHVGLLLSGRVASRSPLPGTGSIRGGRGSLGAQDHRARYRPSSSRSISTRKARRRTRREG